MVVGVIFGTLIFVHPQSANPIVCMLHQEAVKLIEGGIDRTAGAQVWIDLGAGAGTFTRAVAELTGSKGKVYAVDRNKQIL